MMSGHNVSYLEHMARQIRRDIITMIYEAGDGTGTQPVPGSCHCTHFAVMEVIQPTHYPGAPLILSRATPVLLFMPH